MPTAQYPSSDHDLETTSEMTNLREKKTGTLQIPGGSGETRRHARDTTRVMKTKRKRKAKSKNVIL